MLSLTILAAGASLAGPSDDLLAAAQREDRASAARALSAGAAVDTRDADGWSALLFASASGNAEFVRLLLRARADPNQRSNDGQTPLFAAVYSGSAETVRLLLQAGAKADAALPGGKTPLTLARERSRADLVALLQPQAPPASRAKAELAGAAGVPPPAAGGTGPEGRAPPAPASAIQTSAGGGVPDELIRSFLLEVARIDARQSAVGALRESVESRERAAEAERQRAAAAAAERFEICQSRVKSCESNCEQRAISGVLGAVQPGAGRGRATVDTQGVIAASLDGDSCRLNCAQSAACEALRP